MSAVELSRPPSPVHKDTNGFLYTQLQIPEITRHQPPYLSNGGKNGSRLPPTELLRTQEILTNRRTNLRIKSPAGLYLPTLLETNGRTKLTLLDGQKWKIFATHGETFTGMEGKNAPDRYSFEHMATFIEEIKMRQMEERQIGNNVTERRHATAADFFIANWGLPCATEVEMPDNSMLDFVGASTNGKIVIIDFAGSGRSPRGIYNKMCKLVFRYATELKRLHKAIHGTKLNFFDFEPYVVTYNLDSRYKSLTVYNLEDVREFPFVRTMEADANFAPIFEVTPKMEVGDSRLAA